MGAIEIISASVASFIFGALWYGPLFGKTWAKLMNFTDRDAKKAKQKGMAKLLIANFVGTLITVFVLSTLLNRMYINSVAKSAEVAVLLWLGFYASSTLLGGVLWESKPIKLYMLNAVYWLINLIIIGAIVVL